MMKNNVSHADKLLKLIFLEISRKIGCWIWKIQNPEIYFYDYRKGIFHENFSQIGQKCLKNWVFWFSRKSGSKIQNSFLLKTFLWPIQSKIGPPVLEATNKHADRRTSYYFVVLILRKNICPIYLKSLWKLN